MCKYFLAWYFNCYNLEDDFESESEQKDHQKACYGAWRAAMNQAKSNIEITGSID